MARCAAWLCLGLLLVPPGPSCAAKRKRRRRVEQSAVPAIPSVYHEDGSCPFHREDATAKELSEFGHELERDGRQEEALRCYARAVRSAPLDAIGWFDLAVARQYKDPTLALRLYEHGVSLEPSSFHYNQLGVMLRQAERQDEATRRFIQAARLAPREGASADPLFNLAGSHETLGRLDEALHAYRAALSVEAKNEARIQNGIGNVLALQRKWEAALSAYGEAFEADPDLPETARNLGHVMETLQRYDEAAHHMARAAHLLPLEAANLTSQREAVLEKAAKQRTQRRHAERRDEVDKRDGHLTKAERIARFNKVVGACGMDDKACMKEMLGQDDAQEGDLVVF